MTQYISTNVNLTDNQVQKLRQSIMLTVRQRV